jgi:iron complex outermembrane receptor protein
VLFEFDIADSAWQATQEFALEGELSSLPISWKAGAYALFEELDYRQDTLPGVNPGIFKIDQRYEQKTESFAAYGEFQWEILDDLEFEGGARYNWERKSIDADVVIQNNPLCRDSAVRPGPLVCQDAQTFDHPTGLVKLKYSLSEATTVSLKYSHGWKGQQYNVRDGQTVLGAIDLADPEKLDAFEWGFTTEWFEERVKLQGALFWYDYQDYQVFTFSNELGSPPQRIVVNANDAQLYGAELEAQVEPIERLIVDVRFGWLEGKFLDFTQITRIQLRSNPNSPSADIVQIPIDYSGNRLPNTPRFKVSLSAEYTFELDDLGEIVPRYDMSWTDDIFFDQSEGRGARGVGGDFLPAYTIGQRAYALHNIRLTYKAPGGHLEFAGWVRNITNERYKTTAFNSSQGVQLVGNLVGTPRMYGISTSFKF